MRIVVADSHKLFHTAIHLYPNSIFWNTKTSLYSICDNAPDITHLIVDPAQIQQDYNIQCLSEYKDIKIISINNLEKGVNTLLIDELQDINISGEYVLYINQQKSEEEQGFMFEYLDEACPLNIKITGPNKIDSYKYIGHAAGLELIQLIKYSSGCIDYYGNNIYDIAYLEKPCITMVENPLFTNKLEQSKLAKTELPTLIENIKNAIRNDTE